jgi:hypothetical protein
VYPETSQPEIKNQRYAPLAGGTRCPQVGRSVPPDWIGSVSIWEALS